MGLQRPRPGSGSTAPALKRSHVPPLLALFDTDADGSVDWREFLEFILYSPFMAQPPQASDSGISVAVAASMSAVGGRGARGSAISASLSFGTDDRDADRVARELRRAAQSSVLRCADPVVGASMLRNAMRAAVRELGPAVGASAGQYGDHGGGGAICGKQLVTMLQDLGLMRRSLDALSFARRGAGEAATERAAAVERLLRCFDKTTMAGWSGMTS